MSKKNQSQKKKKKKQWPYILVFVLGFLVFLYPQVSRLYYRIDANQEVANFDEEKAKLTTEEVQKRLDLAHAFNESLVNQVSEDPYAEDRKKKGRAEYARMLEIHEKIGHIQIPKIDLDIPIYAGTSEEVLQKGAGHLEGTSLPVGGNSTHSVITAHSGLPKAKLFSDLKDLEVGDRFYVHNLGEILAYQVDEIQVIEPSNFQDLLVVEGHDYVTLLTCTPIMINTHRLLVRGHRVPYDPGLDNRLISENEVAFIYKYVFYAVLAYMAFLVYLLNRYRRLGKGADIELQALKIKKMGSSNQEEKEE